MSDLDSGGIEKVIFKSNAFYKNNILCEDSEKIRSNSKMQKLRNATVFVATNNNEEISITTIII